MYLYTEKNRLNSESHLPPDPDPGIFLKDSSTCEIWHFFDNLAYISGESDRIFMKILSQMCPWTRKYPLNFGNNPDPESGFGVLIRTRTPDPDHILNGGRMHSLIAPV